jgi:formylglycine-generating enzyme required for sulfatase activity
MSKEKTNIEKNEEEDQNYPVRRGGSWNNSAGRAHAANRVRDYSSKRSSSLGFRLALQTKEKK